MKIQLTQSDIVAAINSWLNARGFHGEAAIEFVTVRKPTKSISAEITIGELPQPVSQASCSPVEGSCGEVACSQASETIATSNPATELPVEEPAAPSLVEEAPAAPVELEEPVVPATQGNSLFG